MRSSAKELSQIETTQKAEKALSRGNGISKTNWQLDITKMLRVGVATTAHAETDGRKAKTTPEMQKYRELEACERPEEL